MADLHLSVVRPPLPSSSASRRPPAEYECHCFVGTAVGAGCPSRPQQRPRVLHAWRVRHSAFHARSACARAFMQPDMNLRKRGGAGVWGGVVTGRTKAGVVWRAPCCVADEWLRLPYCFSARTPLRRPRGIARYGRRRVVECL